MDPGADIAEILDSILKFSSLVKYMIRPSIMNNAGLFRSNPRCMRRFSQLSFVKSHAIVSCLAHLSGAFTVANFSIFHLRTSSKSNSDFSQIN